MNWPTVRRRDIEVWCPPKRVDTFSALSVPLYRKAHKPTKERTPQRRSRCGLFPVREILIELFLKPMLQHSV